MKPTDYERAFGRRLAKLIKDRGLTVAEVARRARMIACNLSRILAGRSSPRLITITMISNAIGFPSLKDMLVEMEPDTEVSNFIMGRGERAFRIYRHDDPHYAGEPALLAVEGDWVRVTKRGP